MHTHKHTHFFGLLLVFDLQADDNIQVFQIFQRIRSHENERNFTFGNKTIYSTHHLEERKLMHTFRFLLAAMYTTHVGMSMGRQIHTQVYIHRHKLLAAEA